MSVILLSNNIDISRGRELNLNQIQDTPNPFTREQFDFINLIRMLWNEHGIWTRAAIESLIFDLPDTDTVLSRLLQNPKDFGELLQFYYGDEAGNTFSDLLTQHLVIASDIVKAAKEGNGMTIDAAEDSWYANANEIAAFLGQLNPNWSEENWRNMLYDHLGLVKAEALAILNEEYEEGIRIFETIQLQALGMADEMSMGIIKQFH